MLGIEWKQRQDNAEADEIDEHGDEKDNQRGFLHDDEAESNLHKAEGGTVNQDLVRERKNQDSKRHGMTNDRVRMTKEVRNRNDKEPNLHIRPSSLDSSLELRH